MSGEPSREVLARRVDLLQQAIIGLDPAGLSLPYMRQLFEISLLGLMNDGGPLGLDAARLIVANRRGPVGSERGDIQEEY